MSYRIVFADKPVSPCPDEVWETREKAEQGLAYWQAQFPGRELKVTEQT